ncbi:MAG TPA: DUF1570 domain-containing protein, partial [Thermoanaerobaculia bacterium]
MTRLAPLFAFLVSLPLLAQDVFVPPVPKGIVRDGGKVRTPSGPIPFPDASATWIRVRSERFDILSDASEERTREIVSDVETLAAALTQRNERFAPSRRHATVFIFEHRRESQPYFDLLFAQENARAVGAYARYESGGTMIIDGSRKSGPLRRDDPGIRTAMHELLHDLLRQSESAPPLWLEEGLAEYFSNARVDGDRVIAGDPIREHLALLQRGVPMSLEQLFAVKAESAAGTSTPFYAQSWAAVHWLMKTNSKAFWPFLLDLEKGTPAEEALKTHYNTTLHHLQR